MQEEKQEKLPIDVTLLSDAVIELNILRRSIGLYPPGHPIVKESIETAFNYLQKLFELRVNITLGIARDTLVIDEYTLEKKNPVFIEFAGALHAKGLASVTFSSGLTKEELASFHSVINMKDAPTGTALVKIAEEKGIRHIILSPIDFSAFGFVKGVRKPSGTGNEVWEDYVYGLLTGRLSADGADAVLSIPPEEVANLINSAVAEDTEAVAYDRVITTYLKRKGGAGISRESFDRFLLLVEGLRPELKRQFLSRAFEQSSVNRADVERMISTMTRENFQRTEKFFMEHSGMIPETLKNLIDKLTGIKKDKEFNFDFFDQDTAVLHDIEIGEDIVKLFDEDHLKPYVSEDYQRELREMLKSTAGGGFKLNALIEDCRDEVIDRAALETILELLEADFISAEDYQKLITRLTEFLNIFIETGRFKEILDVYNALSSYALSGRFSHNASSMIEDYFHSEEFIAKLITTLRLWGRKDRDSALRLARIFSLSLIGPLLDAVTTEETGATIRKFLLSILESFGSDVNPHAVKRLNDSRWYVVRNMLYLLRECNGRSYIAHIRRFTKHNNINIRIEALKALLYFKTPDALPNLELCLQSKNTELRGKAVRLAGTYRIRAAVPYLIRLLKKRDLFGTESYYKMDVVRALSEIGDRKAVKELLRICDAKLLFYKSNLEELKVEIFRTIDNYPFDSIRPLIESGLTSKNKEIHSLSEKLMKKYHDYLEES